MFTDPLPDGVRRAPVLTGPTRLERASRRATAHRVPRRVAPAGGWLIDLDTHINACKNGPLPVAEYSVLLMHATPGKCWSISELTDITSRVGFVDITHKPTVGDRRRTPRPQTRPQHLTPGSRLGGLREIRLPYSPQNLAVGLDCAPQVPENNPVAEIGSVGVNI